MLAGPALSRVFCHAGAATAGCGYCALLALRGRRPVRFGRTGGRGGRLASQAECSLGCCFVVLFDPSLRYFSGRSALLYRGAVMMGRADLVQPCPSFTRSRGYSFRGLSLVSGDRATAMRAMIAAPTRYHPGAVELPETAISMVAIAGAVPPKSAFPTLNDTANPV